MCTKYLPALLRCVSCKGVKINYLKTVGATQLAMANGVSYSAQYEQGLPPRKLMSSKLVDCVNALQNAARWSLMEKEV